MTVFEPAMPETGVLDGVMTRKVKRGSAAVIKALPMVISVSNHPP